MKRRYSILAVVLFVVLAAVWATSARRPLLDDAVPVARSPRISPDWAGTVIPPNIAPLNFAIREEGRRFFVRIHSEQGDPIEVFGRTSTVAIPSPPWKALLQANRGKTLLLDVYAQADGQWRQYQTLASRIAEDDIDSYLVYRRLPSFVSKYRKTGIYQRDLTTYRESVVLDGMSLDGTCVNCHSFAGGDARRMSIAMRGSKFGSATLLSTTGGEAQKSAATFGYTAWHPSGRVAAFSKQRPYQFYHAAGAEIRDVLDSKSSLAYCVVEHQAAQHATAGNMPGNRAAPNGTGPSAPQVKAVPGATGDGRLDTYPTWSPDGRYLYYCSAPLLWDAPKSFPPERYAEVKYDLLRVSYDLEADHWGEPETVLSAQQTGLSILMPRISPDGRFLLCCMCNYGCFPPFQPSSDLYLIDLATRDYRRLEINSDTAESWHSWSSNGRWIAFSSKRQAAPLTRIYLSYVDVHGKAHKPFVLPQSNPEYYEGLIEMMNVPELLAVPAPVSSGELTRAARSSQASASGSGARSATGKSAESWQQGHH